MGASLIGHMVRGPVDLDPDLLQSALEDLQVRQQAVNVQYVEFLGVQGDPNDPDQYDDLAEEILLEVLERHFPEVVSSLDHLDVEGMALVVIQTNGEALLADLSKVWGGNARDCAWRDLEDGTRIMFCGESTWGDSPEGYGYQTLDSLVALGMLPLLGLG